MTKEDIVKIIDSYDIIYITSHKSPDGDSYGSTIAFKKMLQLKYTNKKIHLIYEEEIPSYIYKLGVEKEINTNPEKISENSLLLVLDTANKERIALKEEILNKFDTVINIDHHISNTKYATYNYIEDISSVSELIISFIPILNIEINKEIASLIYLGIINDTGNFRHSNTTKSTFLNAAKLMEYGIDISKIYFLLFEKSIKKSKIFGKAMSEANYVSKFSFMYFLLTKNEIEKEQLISEDMDGISEVLLSTKNVDISLFLKETEDKKLKGSLRSKTNFNVSKMAQDLFNGGGHIKAAGFISNHSYEKTIKMIMDYLKENYEK